MVIAMSTLGILKVNFITKSLSKTNKRKEVMLIFCMTGPNHESVKLTVRSFLNEPGSLSEIWTSFYQTIRFLRTGRSREHF